LDCGSCANPVPQKGRPCTVAARPAANALFVGAAAPGTDRPHGAREEVVPLGGRHPGNRLGIGSRKFGTFGAVKFEDGIGLVPVKAMHDSHVSAANQSTFHQGVGTVPEFGSVLREDLFPRQWHVSRSRTAHCPCVSFQEILAAFGRTFARAHLLFLPAPITPHFEPAVFPMLAVPPVLPVPLGTRSGGNPAPGAWGRSASRSPRALRVSAPQPTLQTTRNTGSLQSCRSPRKSTPPGLGAAATRSPRAQAKRAEKE
jgi:hypothetical protein